MKAADVMTATVVTIQPGASIMDAIRLMLGQRISGLPVVDGENNLLGVLTEGDLLHRAEMGTDKKRSKWLDFLRGPGLQADDYVRSHGRKVEEVMTRTAITATEDAPIEQIVDLMEHKRIKRVPIVRGEKLVGVVSRADILRALYGALDKGPAPPLADATLRELVIAELKRQDWGGKGQVTVVVTDGVVYLEGVVYDLRQRDAMRVAAENVPGVKEVEDHLDFVDPNVGLVYGI